MRVIILSKKKVEKGIETLEQLNHNAMMSGNYGLFEKGVELMGDVFGVQGLQYGKYKSDERCRNLFGKEQEC